MSIAPQRPFTAGFRGRLVAAALLALLLWATIAWAEELAASRRETALDRTRARAAAQWKIGSGQERRFEHLLRRLTRDVPPGSRVGWTAPGGGAGDFFLTRWAIYHLPGLLVVPAGPRRPAEDLDFWIAYRTRLERDDLEPVRELPAGALYRVRTR